MCFFLIFNVDLPEAQHPRACRRTARAPNSREDTGRILTHSASKRYREAVFTRAYTKRYVIILLARSRAVRSAPFIPFLSFVGRGRAPERARDRGGRRRESGELPRAEPYLCILVRGSPCTHSPPLLSHSRSPIRTCSQTCTETAQRRAEAVEPKF